MTSSCVLLSSLCSKVRTRVYEVLDGELGPAPIKEHLLTVPSHLDSKTGKPVELAWKLSFELGEVLPMPLGTQTTYEVQFFLCRGVSGTEPASYQFKSGPHLRYRFKVSRFLKEIHCCC